MYVCIYIYIYICVYIFMYIYMIYAFYLYVLYVYVFCIYIIYICVCLRLFIYEGNPPKFKQHTSSCHRTNCQKEFQVMGCYGVLWGMHRHCLGFILVGVWFRWSPQGVQYWWYPRAFDHKFAVVHSHDLFTVHIWDGFVSLFIGWYLPAIKHGNVHRSRTFLWKQEIRI